MRRQTEAWRHRSHCSHSRWRGPGWSTRLQAAQWPQRKCGACPRCACGAPPPPAFSARRPRRVLRLRCRIRNLRRSCLARAGADAALSPARALCDFWWTTRRAGLSWVAPDGRPPVRGLARSVPGFLRIVARNCPCACELCAESLGEPLQAPALAGFYLCVRRRGRELGCGGARRDAGIQRQSRRYA